MLLCLMLAPAPSAALEIYVSPDGKDSDPGTIEQPVLSLHEALDRVAEARKADRKAQHKVFLRGGLYRLDPRVDLTEAVSGRVGVPFIISAYKNETPILSGGFEVSSLAKGEEGILTADLRGLMPEGTSVELVYAGDERLIKARYPNIDPLDPVRSAWSFTLEPDAETTSLDPHRTVRIEEGILSRYERPTEGEISIFPSHQWWNNVVPIAELDAETSTVYLTEDCSYPVGGGDRFFLQGMREDLDAPGEWYFDRELETLLYQEVSSPTSSLTVVRLDELLRFHPRTVEVVVRGITFEHSAKTAVQIRSSMNCRLEKCTFRQICLYDGSGVIIAGGTNNGIIGCDLRDTGSHGILLSGGDL